MRGGAGQGPDGAAEGTGSDSIRTLEGEGEMSKPATRPEQIRQGIVIGGPFIPEAMEVLAVIPFAPSLKVIGRGVKTGQSYDLVLTPEQIGQLTISGESEPFD